MKWWIEGVPTPGADLAAAIEQFIADKSELTLKGQSQGCQDSVEDARTPWTSTVEGLLGTINFTEMLAHDMCDKATYTPYHAVKPHQPRGSIQRVRRITYLDS